MDEGRIIAMGTPREIQDRAAGESVIEIECAAALEGLEIPQFRDAERVSLDERRLRFSVVSRRPARSIVDIMKWLDERGIELADIRIKRPSLEDAFIELTGKSLRE
jgi:ABC-2 type transport system ATP-binding protein